MVCGSFKESSEKLLHLGDEDERALRQAMELACGCPEGVHVADLQEMAILGALADRYEMVEVVAAVEDAMVRSVTVDTCGEVLEGQGQFPRALAAARKQALERFRDLARSRGFLTLSEGVLCSLVADDELAADEEEVVEAVVDWIKGGDEEGRGERLLREIRYGLIEISRLAELGLKAGTALPGCQGVLLRELALEAVAVHQLPPQVREGIQRRLLGSKASAWRVGKGVAWGDYAAGRRQHRVVRDKQDVGAGCESEGRVYGGLEDGSILVLDGVTAEERQLLRTEGAIGSVRSLTACGDLLVSGHRDGSLRVWNKATGRCSQVLRAHLDEVMCIGSWNQYLVSGSCDKTIKIWMGGPGLLPSGWEDLPGRARWEDLAGPARPGPFLCQGTIAAHDDVVWAIVVWNGRVISGSWDEKIKVHDIASRQHEATLDGHVDKVFALAVHQDKLFSTGPDGSICVWKLGSWEHLTSIELKEHVPSLSSPICLALSGRLLICGGYRNSWANGFVLAVDAQTLRCKHTLLVEELVCGLLSLPGEVWGVLGRNDGDTVTVDKVVVWGKAGRAAGGSETAGWV